MRDVPVHLRRYPTEAARRSLAARLDLPYDGYMQDWEWEVAGPRFFPSFLSAYRDGGLDEDERFCLMACLVQSVADMSPPHDRPPAEWEAVAALLRGNPRLHAMTIAYWSEMDEANGWEWGAVGEAMEQLWNEVQALLSGRLAIDLSAGWPERSESHRLRSVPSADGWDSLCSGHPTDAAIDKHDLLRRNSAHVPSAV